MQLLRNGSTVKEIGDFLGQRHPESPLFYAKFDVELLRAVADFKLGGSDLKVSTGMRLYLAHKRSMGWQFRAMESFLTTFSRAVRDVHLSSLTTHQVSEFLAGPKTSSESPIRKKFKDGKSILDEEGRACAHRDLKRPISGYSTQCERCSTRRSALSATSA